MVETMNNIGNRQPDSNAGCSKQKGVKNKQTRQLVLWIGALIVGAVLGIFGISWLDGLMNFIATVYTRLFQLLAVPTIALAVITTLASLGNQADTGKIFRHAITYTLLTTIAAAAVGLVLYNIVSPGNLPTSLVQSGMADVPQKLGETSYYDHILGVIPNNIIKPFADGNVLSILILAAAAGIALTKMPSSDKNHEAYGEEFFVETTKYNPHSPYSASKASSDHFVRAFHDTYGMPTIVTNCSNNYGPYQFPEKLIPLFINNIRHRKPLPVYGKGENVRDWLYVVDHARAIDMIFHKGKIAETYNIGGFNEWKNIDIIKVVIKTVDRLLGRPEGADLDLITYVTDRKGHDMRYAIDSRKLQKELGWEPSLQFEEGIEETVKWYLDNQEWMDNVTSGDYQKYYDNMYSNR